MTSREFAKILGVSQSTLSRALNDSDLVPVKKRDYIKKMAIKYGFVLNSQAQSLKTNRTGTIGILFPRHFQSMNTNLMLAHLYDQIQKELSFLNYDIMVIYDYTYPDQGLSAFERIIKQHKIDGFVILRLDISVKELQLIKESNIPCIHVFNKPIMETDISSCFSDSEYGGYLAGKYLGCFDEYNKFFLNVSEESEFDARKRFFGYKRGLEETGSSLSEDNILNCHLSFFSAYKTIVQLIDRFKGKKSAIFAYNDIVAIGAVNAFRELGLSIPGEVQIIGMDDIPLANQLVPKLSTLSLPVQEIAHDVCLWLKEAIEKNDFRVMKKIAAPKLILRDTTLNTKK